MLQLSIGSRTPGLRRISTFRTCYQLVLALVVLTASHKRGNLLLLCYLQPLLQLCQTWYSQRHHNRSRDILNWPLLQVREHLAYLLRSHRYLHGRLLRLPGRTLVASMVRQVCHAHKRLLQPHLLGLAVRRIVSHLRSPTRVFQLLRRPTELHPSHREVPSECRYQLCERRTGQLLLLALLHHLHHGTCNGINGNVREREQHPMSIRLCLLKEILLERRKGI